MSHRPTLGNETTSALLSQPMGDFAADNELADRILEAALRCVARWGLIKTTVDDVAREAGCSRATIYRAFPGGKQSVI
ncbi:MAG: TetR/AcrR family transcriptional regulator, partial [Acidimicrobiales bacterium]